MKKGIYVFSFSQALNENKSFVRVCESIFASPKAYTLVFGKTTYTLILLIYLGYWMQEMQGLGQDRVEGLGD